MTKVTAVCERCGNERVLRDYKPDPEGKPDKVLRLCQECIDRDLQEKDMMKKVESKEIKSEQVSSDAPAPVTPPAQDEGQTVSLADIQAKIKEHEEVVVKLRANLDQMNQQKEQTEAVLSQRIGAIAGLRDLLK